MRGFFFLLSVVTGLFGMIGMKLDKEILIMIAFLLFPIVVFTAFWMKISYSDILFGICVVALFSLSGLKGDKRK